jgi:succinoglycan biosynthesis protein ExoM
MSSPAATPTISVCVCSYRRPDALRDCLDSLLRQDIGETFEVVVADDDVDQSALGCVTELTPRFLERGIPLIYVSEPHQNIALARNSAVAHSHGSLIAFIDDDETAAETWLTTLSATLQRYHADAVIGAVIPRFSPHIPLWIQHSGVFHRKTAATGTILDAVSCRTGNVLVRRRILERLPFDARLGRTGGEDSWFFRQAVQAGAAICASAESIVFETQEDCRGSLPWHLRRSYRSGWLYTYMRWREGGMAKALPAAIKSTLLGFAKVVATSLVKLDDPRIAGLLLLRGVVSQSGKLAFFVAPVTEEYQARPCAASPSSGSRVNRRFLPNK